MSEAKIRYYQLLCEAEKLAVEHYKEESIALSVLRKNHEPVRFFDGFASCRAWGRTIEFPTLSQRLINQVLWEPWQGCSNRVVKLPVSTVLERAGLEPNAKIIKYYRNQKRKQVSEAIGYLIHIERELVWMGPPDGLK